MTVFETEVGLLSIWDSESLSHIDTMDDYREAFVSDETMLELMNAGSAVIWATGGDGKFDVTVRVDPESDLSNSEKQMVAAVAYNLKLVVTTPKVLIGSPEGVGSSENNYLEQGSIDEVKDLEIGSYLVNIYFLSDEEYEKYVIVLNKVEDDYDFLPIIELPILY